MSDLSIFNMLKNELFDPDSDDGDTFTKESEIFLSKHKTGMSDNAGILGVEAGLTGAGLPRWIKPLAFESNLNKALDALTALEALLTENRNRKLFKIQDNFTSAMLKSLDDPDALQSHIKMSKSFQGDGYKENLELRIVKKFVDLVEYTKAAKLGAYVLFNIDYIDMEASPSLSGLSVIREGLRSLLITYRRISNKDREIIIPISLKNAKSNDQYIVPFCETNDEGARPIELGLEKDQLEINLKDYSPISELKFARIVRIGIRAIDVYSGQSTEVGPSRDDKLDGNFRHDNYATAHQHFWNMTLADTSGGVRYNSEPSPPKYTFEPIPFDNVPGSRKLNEISWSKDGAILNVNPDRKWLLKIGNTSLHNSPKKSILDIILHFHLRCEAR